MGAKLTATGFLIFAVGMLLFVGFLPMVGESAPELSDDYDNFDFEDYSEGDHLIVYGEITDMSVNGDTTTLVLDGQTDIAIAVDGNISGHFREGQEVYVKCEVVEINAVVMKIEQLKAEPYDIHSQAMLDAIFGLIALSGLIVVIVSVVKKV